MTDDRWLSNRLAAAAADMPNNPDRFSEILERDRQHRQRRNALAVAGVIMVAALGAASAAQWQRDTVRVVTSAPATSQPKVDTTRIQPSPRVGDATNGFVSRLRARGLDAAIGGVGGESFLHAAQGRTVHVQGAGLVRPTDLSVNEYSSAASAAADAKRFRPDGTIEDRLPDGTTRRVIPEWIAPLHLYQAGRLLVIYPGTDSTLLGTLTSLLGQPLVGR